MARCKLTNMNLRNIRKSREYQCMIIDLVKVGVVTKSAAESLLDYTIPSGLLSEAGSSSGSSGSDEESGGESGGKTIDDSNITVTLLHLSTAMLTGEQSWVSQEYTPESTDVSEEAEAIIAAAQTAFSDNSINKISVVETNPDYVEGESDIDDKYRAVSPRPLVLTNDMLIVCWSMQSDDGSHDNSGLSRD